MANNYFFIISAVFSQIFAISMLAGYGKYYDFNDSYEPYYYFYDNLPYFITRLVLIAGLGLQYSFVKKSSWTAIAQTIVAAALALEFCQIFVYVWAYMIDDNLHFTDFKISILAQESLFFAFEIVPPIIISYGAFVGRINFFQLYFMVLFESIFCSLNFYLVYGKIELDNRDDPGQGICTHLFGALFGVAAVWISGLKDKNVRTETSNFYPLIGTLIVWVSFPFFNSSYDYCTVNTDFALIGSTIAAFIVSASFNRGKLNVISISRATLSGGVGIASSCYYVHNPGAAVAIGFFSGIFSTVGFELFSKLLKRIYINDSAEILYLHGFPSLFGVILTLFITPHETKFLAGSLFCTLGISIVSGFGTGFLLRISRFTDNEADSNGIELWARDSTFMEEKDQPLNVVNSSNELRRA